MPAGSALWFSNPDLAAKIDRNDTLHNMSVENERHHKAVEEEMKRENRAKEISVLVSKKHIDEAHAHMSAQETLMKMCIELRIVISGLVQSSFMFHDGFADAYYDAWCEHILDEPTLLTGKLIRAGCGEVMQPLLMLSYVVSLLEKGMSGGQLLYKTHEGDNENRILTIRGYEADWYFGQRFMNVNHTDVFDAVERMIKPLSRGNFKIERAIRKKLSPFFSIADFAEKSPVERKNIVIPVSINSESVWVDKTQFNFEDGTTQLIPEDTLRLLAGILKKNRTRSMYHNYVCSHVIKNEDLDEDDGLQEYMTPNQPYLRQFDKSLC